MNEDSDNFSDCNLKFIGSVRIDPAPPHFIDSDWFDTYTHVFCDEDCKWVCIDPSLVAGRKLDEEYYISLRLRDSPYVLPLHGLVPATRWNVQSDDPIVQHAVVLDGILVPFVGSHSELFHDGEWNALYNTESQGVSPSNVNAITVRLTLDGLKVIGEGLCQVDWDFPFLYSPHWYRTAKVEILSAIICHLFTEERPNLSSMDDENIPTVFQDIVRHATGMQTVAQLRQEMWEELQEIRKRGVTILDLV
ncbi:hypothetical protein EV421DRAFT_1733255 [Armillaria borealis]|uniref:Uncharacterized protein n=1 Tax=Armillaria borealis TaxID=47425 RepID=A0AA39JSH1_9AGAR|nr:hypothetical protein EV421DRAFT_1733255 [Armillaria borealis]